MEHSFTSSTPSESDSLEQKLPKHQVTAQPQSIQAEKLNLKVKNQDDKLTFIRMGSRTLFKKMMDLYCKQENLKSKNARFLFDDCRMHENQTPEDVKMQNGDEIDVVIEQTGG